MRPEPGAGAHRALRGGHVCGEPCGNLAELAHNAQGALEHLLRGGEGGVSGGGGWARIATRHTEGLGRVGGHEARLPGVGAERPVAWRRAASGSATSGWPRHRGDTDAPLVAAASHWLLNVRTKAGSTARPSSVIAPSSQETWTQGQRGAGPGGGCGRRAAAAQPRRVLALQARREEREQREQSRRCSDADGHEMTSATSWPRNRSTRASPRLMARLQR